MFQFKPLLIWMNSSKHSALHYFAHYNWQVERGQLSHPL